MVPKKTGEWRVCSDYRALNVMPILDHYPLPSIQDFTANLRGTTMFSKVDLTKAYYEIPVVVEYITKTAAGLWYFSPFRLFQTPACLSN